MIDLDDLELEASTDLSTHVTMCAAIESDPTVSNIYTINVVNKRLYQLTLASPKEIDNITSSEYFDASSFFGDTLLSVAFTEDGTTAYLLGLNPSNTEFSILKFDFGTPWEVDTLTFDEEVFSIPPDVNLGYAALKISPDGMRFGLHCPLLSNYRTDIFENGTPFDFDATLIDSVLIGGGTYDQPPSFAIRADEYFFLHDVGSDIVLSKWKLNGIWDASSVTPSQTYAIPSANISNLADLKVQDDYILVLHDNYLKLFSLPTPSYIFTTSDLLVPEESTPTASSDILVPPENTISGDSDIWATGRNDISALSDVIVPVTFPRSMFGQSTMQVLDMRLKHTESDMLLSGTEYKSTQSKLAILKHGIKNTFSRLRIVAGTRRIFGSSVIRVLAATAKALFSKSDIEVRDREKALYCNSVIFVGLESETYNHMFRSWGLGANAVYRE